jgi:hypothetical protein
LFSIKKGDVPSRHQLRSFGLIVAVGFLVIGLWPIIFRHHSPKMGALAVGIISGTAGLLFPTALRQPYRIWMAAGDVLGWINSKIILSALYFVLLTPVRFLMKLSGYDAMNRKFDRKATTYRVPRNPRPASHMTHQF